MTDTTNTNAAHAAALAMRNAAAALARRRPLYDGASGESADEDLAQAIEDLPLPDVDVTDWKAEAERLRGLLRHEQQERHAVLDRLDAAILARTASQAQAEQYLAELQQARELRRERDDQAAGQAQAMADMQKNIQYLDGLRQGWSTHAADLAQRAADLEALVAELRRERDELSEQVAFTARHLAIISGVLGSPEPIEIDDIAARLHLLIAERDALAARLAEIEAQEPVAWVPIHPRTGPLWSMTTGSPDEERLPHYPLKPLYTRPATPAAKPCRCAEAVGEQMRQPLTALERELVEALQDLMFFDNGKPEYDHARGVIARVVKGGAA